MARDLRKVFREAFELPKSERATLAGLLIESIEGPPDPDVEEEWAAEAERRGGRSNPARSRRFPGKSESEALSSGMKRIRFHPEAEREAAEHEAWYRERSENAAQGFLLELDGWPQVRRGERRYVLPRYPFTLLYRIRREEVSLLLLHTRAGGRGLEESQVSARRFGE